MLVARREEAAAKGLGRELLLAKTTIAISMSSLLGVEMVLAERRAATTVVAYVIALSRLQPPLDATKS